MWVGLHRRREGARGGGGRERERNLSNLMPIIVGDFNCVIDARDLENDSFAYRNVPFLTDYINNNHFIDSFRVLHPATTRFSWHRRGFAAARLDRIYLPPP